MGRLRRLVALATLLLGVAFGGCAQVGHKTEAAPAVKEAQREAHMIEEVEGAEEATEDEANRAGMEAEVEAEIEEHEREREALAGH